jgi:hypothetical protein
MANENRCQEEAHEKHLCRLMQKEIEPDELKMLVKDAKYICLNCGRAAAKSENLCVPEMT